MSDRLFERAVSDWLETGSDRTPPAAIDAVLLAVKTTPQARRGPLAPRRFIRMSSTARLAGAFALIVVVVGVGLVVFGRPGSVGAPSAPPTTAAPPTTTALPSPAVAPTLVPTSVDATGFAVPFQMTWNLPVRWDVKPDVVDIFSGESGMNVFHVDFVGKDPCHSNDLLPQALTTPKQFMDWLATIPKVTLGPVTTLSVGGQPAQERLVQVGTLDGCIDPGELHSGIVSQYGGGRGGYYMSAGETERWIALQAHGKLLAIAIWPHGDTTLGGAAVASLASLQFLP